jgi:hypothetical protein
MLPKRAPRVASSVQRDFVPSYWALSSVNHALPNILSVRVLGQDSRIRNQNNKRVRLLVELTSEQLQQKEELLYMPWY